MVCFAFFNPYNTFMGQGVFFIIHILQVKKLKYKKVSNFPKQVAQYIITGKTDLNLNILLREPKHLTTIHTSPTEFPTVLSRIDIQFRRLGDQGHLPGWRSWCGM